MIGSQVSARSCAVLPGLWLERHEPAVTTLQGAPQSDDAADERVEKAVLCRACQAQITSDRHAIELSGDHHHTFANPAGILFEIACYDAADGCLVVGDPTTEFAWFPGHAWSYALCAACREHLGWYFSGAGTGGFFGLICKKLIEGPGG